MALDLSSLKKAVASLERSLREAHSAEFMEKLTAAQSELVRAGVIQNFEFTFELCWKFVKRRLGQDIGAVCVDGVSRKELFRLAAEHRLVEDVTAWFEYQEARNRTAHTYNENAAEVVFRAAERFLRDATMLLEALERRND